MKRVLSSLQNRILILILSAVVNIAVIAMLVIFQQFYYYFAVSFLVSLLFMFFAYENLSTPSYKFTFALLIFLAPIFGFAVHSLTKSRKSTKKVRLKWRNINYANAENLPSSSKKLDDLAEANATAAKVANNINATTNMSVYDKTNVTYLEDGKAYKAELLKELKNAKQFILIEVTKITTGQFWREVFDLLKTKAIEGVEIRMLYDEKQCLKSFKEKRAFEKFINHGIIVLPFNKIKWISTSFRFSRSKRDLVIIDGKVAFSGNINFCDKKIDHQHPQYKASYALKITGDAVWSHIILYFSTWRLFSKTKIDIQKYNQTSPVKPKGKYFTQVYGSIPFYKENINKNILISMLSLAKKSVLIVQPYFIIDSEIKNWLKIVLRSGVDVKLLVSGKLESCWKKNLTHANFEELIRERIKIYQYDQAYLNNSFILIDDEIVLLGGGLNDIRNTSYNFQLGTLVVGNNELNQKIIQETDKKIMNSHLITLRDLQNRTMFSKAAGVVLKFIYPML